MFTVRRHFGCVLYHPKQKSDPVKVLSIPPRSDSFVGLKTWTNFSQQKPSLEQVRPRIIAKPDLRKEMVQRELKIEKKVPTYKKIFGSHFLENKLEELSEKNEINWDDVKNDAVENAGLKADIFEGVFMAVCAEKKKYNLGKNFLDYQISTGRKLSFVTLSNFLLLSGVCADEADESLIFKTYKELKDMVPVLDSYTLDCIVIGLAATTKWQEAHELLKNGYDVSRPSGMAWVKVAVAAFRNQDYDLCSSLTNYLSLLSRNINEVYLDLLDECKKETNPRKALEKVEKLVSLLHDDEIILCEEAAESFKEAFESKLFGEWKSTLTIIETCGKCARCGKRLKDLHLSSEEFEILRRAFMQRVVQGEDIYRHSNPVELEKFIDFLANTRPYDIVVDGLNVANVGSGRRHPFQLAQMLHDVIEYLTVTTKKRVLLVGRKHMERWPPTFIIPIKQMTQHFFLENLTMDDVYVLYAAMHGREGTKLLSRDMMRNHAFKLGDPVLATHFIHWLHGHQMGIVPSGNKKFKVQPPLRYSPVAISVPGHIHIPFFKMPAAPSEINLPEIRWLCFQKEE